MVAATRESPAIRKRFGGAFAPPSGYRSSAVGPEVTAEEILAGGIDESDFSFPVILTTPSEDRVGDVVVPEGCDYTNFSQSPVIYFDHQKLPLPIGKMRSPHDGRFYFAIEPGQAILGRVWMFRDDGDHGKVCKDLFRLVQDGMLNGISVGFDPRGRPQPLRGGGTLYSEWELLEVSLVGIPANGDCRVLRRYLSDTSKQLHPLVRKSLTAWAEPKQTPLPGWSSGAVLLEKSMSTETHESAARREHPHEFSAEGRREEAESGAAEKNGSFPIENEQDLKDALHDVGRAKDPAAARRHITERAHALGLSEHLPADWSERGGAKEKSLSESSGSDGGYLTTGGEEHGHEDGHAEIKAAIHDRMDDHADEEHGGTHEAHFHAETGAVHHVHGEEADHEHIKGIHADIMDVPGVQRVTHSTERPEPETGWELVYPGEKVAAGRQETKGRDMGAISADEDPKRIARLKAYNRRIAHGQQVQALLKSGSVLWTVKKSTDDCVSKKIKYLHDSGEAEKKGWSDKQVEAIAYSYCGEKKGLLPFVAKALDDYETKNDGDGDADDMPSEPDVTESVEGGTPAGLRLAQSCIEQIEAALPGLEPENRGFWEELMDHIAGHGEERYPGEDFGGADDAGREKTVEQEARENEPAEQEEANDLLSRYKSGKARRVKRAVSANLRRRELQRSQGHAEIIKKVADHMHEVGDMPMAANDKGSHLKGYTPNHHKKMRVLARELDRHHGMLTKADEPEEDRKLTEQEEAERGRQDEPAGDTHEREEVEVEKGIDWSALLPDLRTLHYQATGRRA